MHRGSCECLPQCSDDRCGGVRRGKWMAAAIVLRLDAPCATEVFTIDLNTKSVSGAGHSINKDGADGKIYGGKEESWSYQLSNGFNVYWEQRKKARPLPLRLIQTVFGN